MAHTLRKCPVSDVRVELLKLCFSCPIIIVRIS